MMTIEKFIEEKGNNWDFCFNDLTEVKQNEIFYFDRSNNWDASYFKLENGAEFKIACGDFMSFVNRHSIKVC